MDLHYSLSSVSGSWGWIDTFSFVEKVHGSWRESRDRPRVFLAAVCSPECRDANVKRAGSCNTDES